MEDLSLLRGHGGALVYKKDRLAGQLTREADGSIAFTYLPEYLRSGQPVAFSLPLSDKPVITPNGGVPAFFAGLLPEGHRLTAVQRAVKTSLSDELTLLLAVGADTPGDIAVIPQGADLAQLRATLPVPQARTDDGRYDFSALSDILDLRSIPGVQDKASAQMISAPVKAGSADAILKLNPSGYPHLVENEHAHLQAAARLRLPIAHAELIHDVHGDPGLLVKRFDRTPAHLAQEDAAQIMGLPPASKYNISTEEVITAVATHASAPKIATRNLFLQFLFAWLTGNGDLHAKNVSLLEAPTPTSSDQATHWQVAPMYDLPSTLVYGDRSMALPIQDRTTRLTAHHWRGLAEQVGLPSRTLKTAARLALDASTTIDWQALPFTGSPLNQTLRELRFRRAEAENLL